MHHPLEAAILVIALLRANAFVPRFINVKHESLGKTVRLAPPAYMASLSTAWEWLAEERLEAGEQVYEALKWINATNQDDNLESSSNQSWDGIPLYPIPAVYLPAEGVNHYPQQRGTTQHPNGH